MIQRVSSTRARAGLLSLFALMLAVLLLSPVWPAPPDAAALLSSPALSAAATLYVRPDGGSTDQCTGLADAPYPGVGVNQPCAWDHPFRALPPGGPTRIAGGDTLIVASGSYTMGLGAPETAGNDACSGSWDCHMSPIPSGLGPAQPTRFLGQDWNSGCGRPPELWGTEGASRVVNLAGSSHVTVNCLDITDHSSCAEAHPAGVQTGLTCKPTDTNPPYGLWAAAGIYAADSTNVQLRDLNIHGLGGNGVLAGRLADWTVDNVRIAANGLAGWNGDIGADSSANAGTLSFRRFTVEWNGCPESYPGLQPLACYAQVGGGYGDGFGTGATGGRWAMEDAVFRYNTSDGLDLLYASLPTSTIEIRRALSLGNAGDQIKFTGRATVENLIAVSNCTFFTGQPYMFDGDHCRAGGSALAITVHPSDRVTVTNSTITGEGTALVIAECRDNEPCNGSEVVDLRNSVFVGQRRASDPATNTTFAWYNNENQTWFLPRNPFTTTHSMITGTVIFADANPCSVSSVLCDRTPGLANPALNSFNARLLPGSLAIDAGDNGACPASDYGGMVRPIDGNADGLAVCDIGAYEWRSANYQVYLPSITRSFSLLPNLPVLPFDACAASRYGELRAQLERQGIPLGEAGLRIASIALSRNLTLVTTNIRQFERIPDLAVENWLQ